LGSHICYVGSKEERTKVKRQILALLGLTALTCWLASAAEIDGKWTAQIEARAGGKVTETLTLKATGNKLAGTVQRRRDPQEISDGMINGNNVSFKVIRGLNAKRRVTQEYKGTLSGGQLKLTVSGRAGTMDIVFTKVGS
jgi:hypothetical protein